MGHSDSACQCYIQLIGGFARYGCNGQEQAREKTAQTRFREARDQAQLYKGGLLAGLELAQYRYVVVVTLLDLPKALIPDDVRIGDVIYRHINVAIEPRYPSQQARATAKKS